MESVADHSARQDALEAWQRWRGARRRRERDKAAVELWQLCENEIWAVAKKLARKFGGSRDVDVSEWRLRNGLSEDDIRYAAFPAVMKAAKDWAAFADAWRSRYTPSMNRVRCGEIAWTNLDALHRASLEELVREFGVKGLTEEEKDHLNLVWHRLDPWPDVVEGLIRLKPRYTIAPLSNGNARPLVNMAKRAGLPWDLMI